MFICLRVRWVFAHRSRNTFRGQRATCWNWISSSTVLRGTELRSGWQALYTLSHLAHSTCMDFRFVCRGYGMSTLSIFKPVELKDIHSDVLFLFCQRQIKFSIVTNSCDLLT